MNSSRFFLRKIFITFLQQCKKYGFINTDQTNIGPKPTTAIVSILSLWIVWIRKIWNILKWNFTSSMIIFKYSDRMWILIYWWKNVFFLPLNVSSNVLFSFWKPTKIEYLTKWNRNFWNIILRIWILALENPWEGSEWINSSIFCIFVSQRYESMMFNIHDQKCGCTNFQKAKNVIITYRITLFHMNEFGFYRNERFFFSLKWA